MAETSTKPYLIRAIYEWCNDNGFTPYLAVAVDERTEVPREHVKAGEIVLNVSPTATNRLQLGNELVTFQARFGGRARDLSIPVENVTAIYARENGHGMAFDVPKAMAASEAPSDEPVAPAASDAPASGPRAHPARAPLTRVPDPGEPTAPLAASPATPPMSPDEPPPEGGTPRGRPQLTRVK
jgi:stringent starvation protein B